MRGVKGPFVSLCGVEGCPGRWVCKVCRKLYMRGRRAEERELGVAKDVVEGEGVGVVKVAEGDGGNGEAVGGEGGGVGGGATGEVKRRKRKAFEPEGAGKRAFSRRTRGAIGRRRLSEGTSKGEPLVLESLGEDAQRFVEWRLRGATPTEAVRKMALEDHEGRVTVSALLQRSRRWYRMTEGIVQELQSTDGMSDSLFEKWAEKQVTQVAEKGTTGARIVAIAHLRKVREDRKYGTVEELMETIGRGMHRMEELTQLVLEARGMGRSVGMEDVG